MMTQLKISPSQSSAVADEKNEIKFLTSYIQDKKYALGATKAKELLALYPDNLQIKKSLAFCLGMSGELLEAKSNWLQLIELDPYSEEYLLNLSFVEQKLGRLNAAIGLLKLAAEYHPDSAKPWMSLGEAFTLNGDLQRSVDSSLEAIKRQPENPEAFQNLGSNLFSLAMFNEAQHAFETAILLNPNIQEAKSSLSAVLFRKNRANEAAELLEDLISQHCPSSRMSLAQLKWNAALIQLRLGNLQKGWEYYEEGFNPDVQSLKTRAPNRTFAVPRWTPSLPKSQTVLVWREQGIGDDLIFLTCLQDLIDEGYKPLVECDLRMIELFKRSFPGVEVREAMYRIDYPHDSPHHDFDSHLPMGSLMMHFRPSIKSFEKTTGSYLKVDPIKLKFWNTRLQTIRKSKKLVGICWRGGLTDAVGKLKYSKLMDWGYLLSSNEFEFVNLQFGECEEELREVEVAMGISIHRWSDLDLKNDIDDVCALISNLDYVVTISSAVWAISAALGKRTSLLLASPHWTMFNLSYIPFFSSVKCFCANDNLSFSDVLPQVKEHLLPS